MTNMNKSKRGLDTASSSICGHVLENSMHALTDCWKARKVWSVLKPTTYFKDFYMQHDFMLWFEGNIKMYRK